MSFSRELTWILQFPFDMLVHMSSWLTCLNGHATEVTKAIDPDSTSATNSCCVFSLPLSAFGFFHSTSTLSSSQKRVRQMAALQKEGNFRNNWDGNSQPTADAQRSKRYAGATFDPTLGSNGRWRATSGILVTPSQQNSRIGDFGQTHTRLSEESRKKQLF